MDNKKLEEILVTQAKKAAELIKDEIPIQLYDKLCGTIIMCQNYVQGADGLSREMCMMKFIGMMRNAAFIF